MNPFDQYPAGGRQLLGKSKGSNCRHEYGLEFMRLTGQHCCAYCERDLTVGFETWVTMALDHVVPVSVCKAAGIAEQFCEDLANTVLACGACNGLDNRFQPSVTVDPHRSIFDLRDAIFAERKARIKVRREQEEQFFRTKPWELQSVQR